MISYTVAAEKRNFFLKFSHEDLGVEFLSFGLPYLFVSKFKLCHYFFLESTSNYNVNPFIFLSVIFLYKSVI